MFKEHYPTLDRCQKLQALGFPKTHMLWYWNCEDFYSIGYPHPRPNEPDHPEIICPSVMEMLDVMPDHISFPEDEGKGWDHVYQLMIGKRVIDMGYDISYARIIPTKPHSIFNITLEKLPNALADTILWLHEKGYIF